MLAGRYHAEAPVAVGAAGLAQPQDGADFDADDRTVLRATAGVVVHLDPGPVHVEGPGTVRAQGTLRLRNAEGEQPSPTVAFGPGAFDVTLTPGPDGLDVQAVLQRPPGR
jgi:hypothetical protein